MKVLRLRIAGFGPYRAEQAIDFEQFDADGIFVITGKTGSGKSSILDGICFALYGSVPRYANRAPAIRSQHCSADEPTFAQLDFRLRGADYRIRRSPEYQRASKRSGGGLVTAAPTAELAIQDSAADGGWRVIATGAEDVNLELSAVLPIKRDQFLQVMLLAQNRFQEFLLAKTDERRAVLRTLFGTDRFEQLETTLLEQRRALDARVAATAAAVQSHVATVAAQALIDVPSAGADALPWLLEAAAGIGAQRAAAVTQLADARAVQVRAEGAFRAAADLHARQVRRSRAADELATLEQATEQISALRSALDAANRAERVWPQVTAQRRSAGDFETAAAALQVADGEWATLGEQSPDLAADDLEQVVERLQRALGTLAAARADERGLPALQQRADAADRAVAEHDETFAARQARIAELPALRDELAPQLAAASTLAASVSDRSDDVDRLVAARDAALRAEALEPTLAGLRTRAAEASSTNRAAAEHYEQLLHARVDNQAFELAAGLVDGEPCAVCGATAHPAPATTDAPQVSPDDLDRAKAAIAAAQRALEASTDAVAATERQLAEARTQAGSSTSVELAPEIAAARERFAAAEGAATTAATLQQRLAAIQLEETAAAAELAALLGQRADLIDGRAVAVAARDAARSRVESGRGADTSVAHRVARLEAALAAARAVLAARAIAANAQINLVDADAVLADQLEAERFDDVAAVDAARLTAPELEAARDAMQRHDERSAAVRSVLAEPDLQDLPEEQIDVDPLNAAADAARADVDSAIAAESALAIRAANVEHAVGVATALLHENAQLLAERDQVSELAAVIHGDGANTKRMRLETFVLAAHLEEIIVAANRRLTTMTAARYELVLDDARQYRNNESGLGLGVLDAHTGAVRQTASLSGGEMFLASLALALGLAEVVSNQAGGIALDTLFVDEGFGSLDGETLDTAMAALEDLRAGGRTIGLISHVDSMKERIAAKLSISVRASGDSEIDAVRV